MEDIKKEYYGKCEEIAIETGKIFDVDRLTQEQFLHLIEQQMKLIWVFIESKIKDAKIAENERWLGKFQSRYLICAFEDRIKELKEMK